MPTKYRSGNRLRVAQRIEETRLFEAVQQAGGNPEFDDMRLRFTLASRVLAEAARDDMRKALSDRGILTNSASIPIYRNINDISISVNVGPEHSFNWQRVDKYIAAFDDLFDRQCEKPTWLPLKKKQFDAIAARHGAMEQTQSLTVLSSEIAPPQLEGALPIADVPARAGSFVLNNSHFVTRLEKDTNPMIQNGPGRRTLGLCDAIVTGMKR